MMMMLVETVRDDGDGNDGDGDGVDGDDDGMMIAVVV